MKARKVLPIAALLLWTLPAQSQQPAESQSCSGKMTEQLRRFNEQCLTDLVSFVASQPKASARVLGEKLKFSVQLTRTGAGLDAEAVSRANFPFMEAKTADALKQLGWSPPENGGATPRALPRPTARRAQDRGGPGQSPFGLRPDRAGKPCR